MNKIFNLYWIYDIDHECDWFYVDFDSEKAIERYRNYNGMDESIELDFMLVKHAVSPAAPGMATTEYLEDEGATLMHRIFPNGAQCNMIVFEGVTFVEGGLDATISAILDELS